MVIIIATSIDIAEPKGDAMKVIGYIRVSTDKQAEDGDSIELQREKVRQYCDLHDHDLVELYTDSGASGKNMDRDGLHNALSAVESGEADALLVTS